MRDLEHPERKRIRLKDYDYSQNGAYFITICTKDRKQLLWRVGATSGRPNDIIPLSDVGKIIYDEIEFLSNIYENVSVDKSVIMPNHIHLIICIGCDTNRRSETAPTVSQIVQQFKGSTSKKAGFSLWQKSFYDHIIRNEKEYLDIWEYIDSNPYKWTEDEYYYC